MASTLQMRIRNSKLVLARLAHFGVHHCCKEGHAGLEHESVNRDGSFLGDKGEVEHTIRADLGQSLQSLAAAVLQVRT